MVKKGGKMVYATCSILPQENNEQVRQFLASEEGAAFSLSKEKNIYSHKTGYDGFYMALLEKK
jgi:16S rRNA (cytosine967-C5)-methyltransferase